MADLTARVLPRLASTPERDPRAPQNLVIARYEKLGLPAGPFQSVQLLAPVRRGAAVAIPDTGSRQEGVTAYYWSLLEFCRDRYLRFLFA